MMTRKTLAILGGSLVILGGVGFWATRLPQHVAQAPTTGRIKKAPHPTDSSKVTPTPRRHSPHHSPHVTDPTKHRTQPVSLAASFQASSHHPLPSGVTPVSVPWQPHTLWVFVPQAIQGQLWFASRQGSGSWHWVSEDLPGMLSRQLPSPVYDTLQWAADLHANEPGPNLPGAVQWNVITGRVGEPVGWTTQILPANQSPVGHKALELTVWLPSETGGFHGVYGIETLWDAHNAQTGHGALLMLTAASHGPGKGGTP